MLHSSLRLLLASCILAACGPSVHPMDDVLRVNHSQSIGTHNSYHLQMPDTTIVEWQYSHEPLDVQAEELGVRQFELDAYWDGNGGFEVLHVPVLDPKSTCPTLTACLGLLKSWSDEHPAHIPLMILIEPKDNYQASTADAMLADLEAVLLDTWGRDRLIVPEDVRGSAADLATGVRENGWPTLGEARGKAVVQLLDRSAWRDALVAGDPSLADRLIFPDAAPDDPWAAFVLLDDPVARQEEIRQAALDGMLIRTRADAGGAPAPGDTTRNDAALSSGAQALSTDFPGLGDGSTYSFAIPEGTPSRCNPVTAPAECSTDAVEDPRILHRH